MAKNPDGHDNEHAHGIRPYVIVALILGVITFVEFYIVEYPVAWLGDGATLFWLVLLSAAKFLMVIMYFMHLKGDDPAYSGFFGSGMFIALGTFVAFSFLMTAPGSLSFVRASLAPDGKFVHGEATEEPGGPDLDEAVVASIESDGYSRELPAVLGDGRPKDLSVVVTPPAAAEEGWSLAAPAPSDGAPAAAALGAADGDAPAEAAPSDEAPVENAATPAGEPTPAAQATAGDWDAQLGETVFAANCASCHQASGQGIPGAFPPLAGHAPELVAADGGRAYLANTLLYGLQGQIAVGGTSYNGVMPAWAHLGDDQLAAVANHVLYAWDNDQALPDDFAPIARDEIAAARGAGLTGQDVHALREELALP